MVAADEIAGWAVAGTITLIGVLVASYLTGRAERQVAHFNSLKGQIFQPWASWLASIRTVPSLVVSTVAADGYTGFKAQAGYLPVTLVACIRRTHYPDLCKRWDALDLEYRQLVYLTMDLAQSLETHVTTLVGGQRVRLNYRDPREFPGYNPELVRLLVEGVISRVKNEPWSLPKVSSEIPQDLVGKVREGTTPWWINLGGTTMVNWLAENERDSMTIESKFASSLGEIMENPELVKKAQVAMSAESGFQVHLKEFRSHLDQVLSFDQALPGICHSVEPRRYFRLFTLMRERV